LAVPSHIQPADSGRLLDWCGASRADPLPLEGLRERFLPERTFRGRAGE